MKTNPPINVLLIEDSPSDARLIEEMLADAPRGRFTVVTAPTLAKGLQMLRQTDVHAILLDLTLPDSDGIDTFHAVIKRAPSLPVIVLTMAENEALGQRMVQEGAQDYVPKDVLTHDMGAATLIRTIRYAIERKRADVALQKANEQVHFLNERLHAANEDLHTLNKELRYGVKERTEELNVSNEELRVTNEELSNEVELRAAAERDAQRRAHRTAILNEVIHVLNEALDLPSLYERSLTTTIEQLRFESGFISVVTDEGYLEVQRAYHISPTEIDAINQIHIDSSPYVQQIYREHELIILDEAQSDSNSYRIGHRGAMVGIPLISEGGTIGHVMFYAAAPRSFSREERELFQTIGLELGTAVARLRAKEQVQEYARQQKIITEIITAGNQAGTLQSACIAMLDAAMELLDVTDGAVFLYDEAENGTELQYARGFNDEVIDKARRTPQNIPFYSRVMSGEPVFLDDYGTQGAEQFRVLFPQLHTFAIIPLVAENRVIGNYNVGSSRTRPFTDAERSLLISIGQQAGTVIARLQAEERIKQYANHLEDLVEERTAQLQNAERLAGIGETAAMIGHDLRNPLQAMLYMVDLQKARSSHLSPDQRASDDWQEVQTLCARISEQISYMDKIVSDLQDYARPIVPEREEVAISEFIDDVLESLPRTDGVQIVTDVDDLTVTADSRLMQRVFTNIFLNALQAMPNGGTLTISATSVDDSVVINVSDTGIGIPLDIRDKIFSPLTTSKAKGTGLGLAVVKRIVDAHGGTIAFESEEGKGTMFTIRLPTDKRHAHSEGGGRA